ncbi:BAG domain-containing protein [Heracleum sosnowskyi]|uniref:BAG domain-containing protein n=1 Tax=Heracleum sosnowskyi TaxID=360622 RepID=A0AAD8I9X9_9APIA|nr:BAG domain-containing protein [Heracleum sosnowskyi]
MKPKPRHQIYKNDHSTPPSNPKLTTQIPTTSPPPPTLHSAATKIQSTYKTHLTKTLFKKISAVNSSAAKIQTLIQLQETVDLVRSNDLERLKINEALMELLLILDSVPGWDPNIRELRRNVSRKIVGLQEILDGVIGSRVENWDDCVTWDEVVEKMETEVCEERGLGGFEMEKFCAEKLGFRCLQRFLRDQ